MRNIIRNWALGACAAAACVGLAAGPAAAGTVMVTFDGVVGQFPGSPFFDPHPDGFGIGATPGGSFDGTKVSLQFLINTAQQPGQEFLYTEGVQQRFIGSGAANPILSSSVTINGAPVTCALVGACAFDLGTVERVDFNGTGDFTVDQENFLQTSDPSSDPDDPVDTYQFAEFHLVALDRNGGFPGATLDSLDSLHGFSLTQNSDSTDAFVVIELDYQRGDEQGAVFFDETRTYGVAYGTVTIDGVPEPAAWALMIAGFGLTGAALRRRRAWTARRFALPPGRRPLAGALD